MKYDCFAQLVGALPYFDLSTVVQVAGDNRHNLRIQLSRWVADGKLVSLRRGMYAMAEQYRRAAVNLGRLANDLYRPSYLSLQWALGFHGLIPDAVAVYQSATSRKPAEFSNTLGRFQYRHLKQEAFFGYEAVELDRVKVLVAQPEKALLDLWHLSPGLWTVARMTEMRFQNGAKVDRDRLREYARRFNAPRLVRAADVWCRTMDAEEEGYETV